MKHISNLNPYTAEDLSDICIDINKSIEISSDNLKHSLQEAIQILTNSKIVQPEFAEEIYLNNKKLIDELTALQSQIDRLHEYHSHITVTNESARCTGQCSDCEPILVHQYEFNSKNDCPNNLGKCITKIINVNSFNSNANSFQCGKEHDERCSISPTDDDVDPHHWAEFDANTIEGLEQIERGECISHEEVVQKMEQLFNSYHNCRTNIKSA